jgi:hypothetical protein
MDEEEQIRRELDEFKLDVGRTAAEMTAKTYEVIGRSITDWSRMEGFLVHIVSAHSPRCFARCAMLGRSFLDCIRQLCTRSI